MPIPETGEDLPDYLPEPPALPLESDETIMYSAPPVPPLISEPQAVNEEEPIIKDPTSSL